MPESILPPDQIAQLHSDLTEVRSALPDIRVLPDNVRKLGERLDQSEHQLRKLAFHRSAPSAAALCVSDHLATVLGSIFVVHCAASGKLESLSSKSGTRDALLTTAATVLG